MILFSGKRFHESEQRQHLTASSVRPNRVDGDRVAARRRILPRPPPLRATSNHIRNRKLTALPDTDRFRLFFSPAYGDADAGTTERAMDWMMNDRCSNDIGSQCSLQR